jgi:hypothetical protein
MERRGEKKTSSLSKEGHNVVGYDQLHGLSLDTQLLVGT